MKYLRPIDTHAHFRWDEYLNYNFIKLGFRDSRAVGLAGVLEMPNTTPQLTTIANIADRIVIANKHRGEIYHGIYAGTSEDMAQVKNIVLEAKKSMEANGRINGIKIFHCQSTGKMGITDHDKQREIWEILGGLEYKGVVTNHFEDEESYTGDFDYTNPITHSIRQNPESELIQAERQVRNAKDFKFQGIMVSAHTSNPDTVDYLISERKNVPFDIAIEMTLHHMFLNTEDYSIHKNRVKMNPPLRVPILQQRNLEHVLKGNIDFIGTDHAPHPIEEKDSKTPKSGIPAIPFYPRGIELLRNEKIREIVLQDITFNNANRIFKLGLAPRLAEVEYNPLLWVAYGYNPFSRIDGTI